MLRFFYSLTRGPRSDIDENKCQVIKNSPDAASSKRVMAIVMNCGCTNHIIPHKSMLKTLSMQEWHRSPMFTFIEDRTQQRIVGQNYQNLIVSGRLKLLYTHGIVFLHMLLLAMKQPIKCFLENNPVLII